MQIGRQKGFENIPYFIFHYELKNKKEIKFLKNQTKYNILSILQLAIPKAMNQRLYNGLTRINCLFTNNTKIAINFE